MANYDYTGASVTLGILNLDNLSGGTETLVMSANNMTTGGNECVADLGAGMFNQSGGVNQIASSLMIGQSSGSNGSYILSGTGTLSASESENIGEYGAGSFNQTGGANSVVASGALFLGFFGGASGEYSLSAGTLDVSGGEDVGLSGAGTVNQSGGTNITSSQLEIGAGAGSTGTYVLSGAGVLSVGGDEYVGVAASSGTFNQSGGTNTVGTTLFVGFATGSTGSFTLSGGTLNVEGNAYIGGSATGVGGQGNLTVSGSGQLSVTGALQVWNDGQLNISGNTASVGGLTIATGGVVNINSALLISTDGGNARTMESTIQQFIKSGAIVSSGAPSGYGMAYADGSDAGLEDRNLKSGQVIIEPDVLGDADMNGTVNFHDLQDLLGGFGSAGFWDQGNFNGHATVDFNDLQMLLGNFSGSTTLSYSELNGIENLVGEFGFVADANPDGTGFTLTVIPEPAAGPGLVVVGTVGVLKRRRRQSIRCMLPKLPSDARR